MPPAKLQEKDVSDEYPELVHYTSASGLTGILNSQAIWATHASFLNDTEEIKLFFNRRLSRIIEDEFRKTGRSNDEELIQGAAAQFTESIRKVTLAFNQPYVFSMCAPKDAWTSRNGLLSQWRGYGKDGAYAIIFDSKMLKELIDQEVAAFHYQHMQWGDVHYYDESLGTDRHEVAPEILTAETELRAGISAFKHNPTSDVMESTYTAITSLSCFHKHRGFEEEKEIRIIAIPAHQSIKNINASESRPAKDSKTFIRDGCPVPYIELFSNLSGITTKGRLPIKRIIVGPHRNKLQRKEAVEIILDGLGIEAEVDVSETPYIG
ncbi:hypothetical protein os1_01000 [Comamonadaceae bacterium OS-1]|nr:hypothetical protein os1_01000 [Comamonadaceae bacterium OS-1]